MKNFLKTIKNLIIGIIVIIYISFITLVSIIMLNTNNYGITQIKDKTLFLIDKNVSNENYLENTLVIIENKEIQELKNGEEIFIYEENKYSNIKITYIEKINLNDKYIETNGEKIKEEYIIGTKYKTNNILALVFQILKSKTLLLSIVILPCLIMLIYGIILLITAIKKHSKINNKTIDYNYEITPNNENSKKLNNIQQIDDLKNTSTNLFSCEIIEDKNEKIDELMKEISELRKEYDTQELFVLDKPNLNTKTKKDNDKKQVTKNKEVKKEKQTSNNNKTQEKNNKNNKKNNSKKTNTNNKTQNKRKNNTNYKTKKKLNK